MATPSRGSKCPVLIRTQGNWTIGKRIMAPLVPNPLNNSNGLNATAGAATMSTWPNQLHASAKLNSAKITQIARRGAG